MKNFMSKDLSIDPSNAYLKGVCINITRRTVRDPGSPLYYDKYGGRRKGEPNWYVDRTDFIDITEENIIVKNIIALKIDTSKKDITVWAIKDTLRFLIKLDVNKDGLFEEISNDINLNFLSSNDYTIVLPIKRILGKLKVKPPEKSKHGKYREAFFEAKRHRQAIEHAERMKKKVERIKNGILCNFCNQDIRTEFGCSIKVLYDVFGHHFIRIKVGDEKDIYTEYNEKGICKGCNTKKGYLHHYFCKYETCPKCGKPMKLNKDIDTCTCKLTHKQPYRKKKKKENKTNKGEINNE